MPKTRINISLDPEVKKELEERAKRNNRNVSEEITALIKNTSREGSAAIAIARASERELHIIKGMLNSMFMAVASLSEAEYVHPDKQKHHILDGAEKAEVYRLKEAA